MYIDRGDFFFNAICQLTEAVFSNPSMIKVYEDLKKTYIIVYKLIM